MPNNHAIGCRGTGRSHKRYAATHKPCAQHPQTSHPAPTTLSPSSHKPSYFTAPASLAHTAPEVTCTRAPCRATVGRLQLAVSRRHARCASGWPLASEQPPCVHGWWEAGAALL